MNLRLLPHPLLPDRVAAAVHVTVTPSTANGLDLVYGLRAPAVALRCPVATAPARRDGLWRTTCAELFIAAAGSSAYREFNFSPSGDWAVYDFADTRQRVADPVVATAPRVVAERAADTLTVRVTLAPDLLPAAPWRAALCVVVEAADGALAYWALTHPASAPDFHHRDGFCLAGPSPLTLEPR